MFHTTFRGFHYMDSLNLKDYHEMLILNSAVTLALHAGEDPEAFAETYMHEYREHIFRQPEMVIENIIGKDVEDAVQALKATAGGTDQWDPADLKLLSPEACKRLADLYNMVEAGAPWLTAAAGDCYRYFPGFAFRLRHRSFHF